MFLIIYFIWADKFYHLKQDFLHSSYGMNKRLRENLRSYGQIRSKSINSLIRELFHLLSNVVLWAELGI